ncbi:flagellar hook-basal body complex protein FliE [Duganella sp. CF458]|uniref:flagellar hook-basal body complex protein FliE n=1 Tax=Duganella sp. CF458 TaxID=1884368 RepID=UPI0008E89131|nr:flagellar hook-basal body complex protein FliE [Duganella sp. CF458]SFG88649.1 flagellar hook-basal body complex protein FliE [Duganella sp. CF458]
MSAEAIAAIGAVEPSVALAAPQPAGSGALAAPGFGDWLAHEAAQVNASLALAENDVRRLASGQVQNLHEVMIHLEEAKLSFQLLAQVRNRVLEAYQEVMRMQV